jgi:galactokinase
MQIIYQDEYGSGIYWGQSSYPAAVGDTVIVDDEEYYVTSRVFFPQEDKIVITVTQTIIRSKAPQEDGTRLKEMQRAIVDVNKRQDLQEKRTKALREQAMSIRQHIRRNTPKPKDTQ